MESRRVVTGLVLIGALATSPVFANEGQRRRDGADRREQDRREQSRDERRDERAERQNDRGRERAVPRARVDDRVSQEQVQRQREYEARRQAEINRQRDNDRWRGNNGRAYGRPYYANRGYGSRTVVVPRVIRPQIVTVVPYRPYVYRPSIGHGVYYGTGGAYPYGYTPRGYYDPIPGRIYGGLRITDAPRDAQVFADGYYVGIVNDFDGVFQHLNLEAGPHRIEIRLPGYYDAIVFDVVIQPGRTITYRADWF